MSQRRVSVNVVASHSRRAFSKPVLVPAPAATYEDLARQALGALPHGILSIDNGEDYTPIENWDARVPVSSQHTRLPRTWDARRTCSPAACTRCLGMPLMMRPDDEA